MRFRAQLSNPVGLHKIAQTLEKLGQVCVVSFSMDSIRFIKNREGDGGIQAWVKLQPPSLFTNYRIESLSHNNEISMSMRIEYLLRATRAAQASSEIKLVLRRKNGQPIIDWRMVQDTRAGSTCEVGQEINVSILPPDRLNTIKEPTFQFTPDAYILLPRLQALKPVADRMKSQGKFLTLSANMAGVFRLCIGTELVDVEATFRNLENPQLEGHEPTENHDTFASVRISTEDFVNFLNCYHMEPQNVICSISNEQQVAFYVYADLNGYQLQEPRTRPPLSYQTIMTCHIPVYYD